MQNEKKVREALINASLFVGNERPFKNERDIEGREWAKRLLLFFKIACYICK